MIFLGIYVLGFVLMYASDGWLDWSGNDMSALMWLSLAWPLTIWVLIADSIRKLGQTSKKKRIAKKEMEEKFRIAAMKELEQYEEEIEQEIRASKKRAR